MNTLQRIILVAGVIGLGVVAWHTPTQFVNHVHRWLWEQAAIQCSIVTLATGGLFLAAWRVKA
jgi:adenosyl cobinamide kinase/adenosyl cobinamide phosphate guanylyltransferase